MDSRGRIVLILGLGLTMSACFSSSDTPSGPDAGGAPEADAGTGMDGASDGGSAADAGTDAASDGATADGGGTGDGGAVVTCTPSGAPVTHTSDIVASETWASGIHVVANTLQIKTGARLTVAACSEVRLAPGASINVTGTAAGLDAVGTDGSPIRFVPLRPGMPWGSIEVTAPAVANLTDVTLSGGGTGPHASSAFGGASLVGNASDPARPVVLALKHVKITGSAGLGIFLRSASFDPQSLDLAITGSGWYPMYLGVASADTVPSGTYTGNALDQILLQSFDVASYDDTAPITSDVTIHDYGVPYRVGTAPSSIEVGDGVGGHPSASLTLAAGVHLLFTPQGAGGRSQILVTSQDNGGTSAPQGALIVQGTSAAPVVLDSAGDTPAPGDWQGLYFSHLVDPRTSIAYARILHAGGASGAVGICGSTPAAPNGAATCAIVVLADQAPAAFLANSTIDSAPCGVYRGWSMGAVNFIASNAFSAVPGCSETSIPQAGGQCAACPTAP